MKKETHAITIIISGKKEKVHLDILWTSIRLVSVSLFSSMKVVKIEDDLKS
jgi:hypothetical protein